MKEKVLFPPEILEHSVESYFSKQHYTGKIIYLIIVLTIIISISILPLIKVDITTQSRGIIRSKLENNSIISGVNGKIKNVNIKNNQYVHKGDTLIIVNSEHIKNQIAFNRQKIEDNTIFITDLQKLLYGGNIFQTGKYLSENQLYKQKNNEQEILVSQLKKEYELNKQLYKNKAIAQFEYEQIKNKYELALNRMLLMRKQKRNEWQIAMNEYSRQNEELRSKIKQLKEEKKQYIITATENGTITEYQGIKAGNFITINQKIAQISPDDELIVECYVSPKDIGFIQKNMDVNFQLDAFNYNQWGLANGKVIEIPADISNINNQPVFVVKCKLENTALKLRNGYIGKLQKGMTLTGRFKLNKRSLFDLLYDKTDDWLNPKIANSKM
ncbi:MAG: HlyD family secretion protein [Bacteroidales bacterium]|nr:HlyD family secretion protein [Bacteroidales bacterium]